MIALLPSLALAAALAGQQAPSQQQQPPAAQPQAAMSGDDEDEPESAADSPASTPARAAPAAPAGTLAALRSPPDPYGIPRGLYLVDADLAAARDAMEQRASRARSIGGIAIGAGTAELAAAALFFWLGKTQADMDKNLGPGQHDVRNRSTSSYIYAGFFSITGVAAIVYGFTQLATRPDPTQLRHTYDEKYGTP